MIWCVLCGNSKKKNDWETEGKNNIDWHLLTMFCLLPYYVSFTSIVLIPMNALFACLLAGWLVWMVECLFGCLFVYLFVVVILFSFFTVFLPSNILFCQRNWMMPPKCFSVVIHSIEMNGMEIAKIVGLEIKFFVVNRS